MKATCCQNTDLKAEIEKHIKEKNEYESYFRKYDEDLRNLVLRTRAADECVESIFNEAFQARNDLEAELQRTTVSCALIILPNLYFE